MILGLFDFNELLFNNAPKEIELGGGKDECFSLNDINVKVSIWCDIKCSKVCTDKSFVVIDGIIYNGINIRKQYSIPLETSDAELIAMLVERNSFNIKEFLGKYSILIYNRDSQEIMCVVDRFAEKKMCYCVDKTRVIISTSVKEIARIRNNYNLDYTAVAMFFAHNYICAPLTIFEGICKIGPGCMTKINGRKIDTVKYWDAIALLHKHRDKLYISLEEAKSEFKIALCRSINLRVDSLSDCHPALLLSGGIDSSILCSLLKNQRNIKAYVAQLKDKDNDNLDESEAATIIANKYGIPLEVVSIDTEWIKNQLIEIMASTDEPMANKSYPVAYYLIGRAKQDGCNIVFTGDGGDELFLGYPRYQRMIKSQVIAKYLNPLCFLFETSIIKRIVPRKLADMLIFSKKSPRGQYLTAIKEEMLSDLMKHDFSNLFYPEEDADNGSWLLASNHLDLYYGTQAAIRKWNDISMNYDVNHFSPMLDEEMVLFSSSIPESFKMTRNQNKIIMRKIISEDLPDIGALPKHGFTVPVQKWLRNSYMGLLNKYFDKSFIESQGVFCADGVNMQKERFLKGLSDYKIDTNSFIYSYFVLQTWLNGLNQNLK